MNSPLARLSEAGRWGGRAWGLCGRLGSGPRPACRFSTSGRGSRQRLGQLPGAGGLPCPQDAEPCPAVALLHLRPVCRQWWDTWRPQGLIKKLLDGIRGCQPSVPGSPRKPPAHSWRTLCPQRGFGDPAADLARVYRWDRERMEGLSDPHVSLPALLPSGRTHFSCHCRCAVEGGRRCPHVSRHVVGASVRGCVRASPRNDEGGEVVPARNGGVSSTGRRASPGPDEREAAGVSERASRSESLTSSPACLRAVQARPSRTWRVPCPGAWVPD